MAYFLSSRDETTRRSFVAGFVVLWSVGVWTYLALPALGPAYAFSEEFLRFRDQLRGSALFQRALFENYQQVFRFALGRGEPLINLCSASPRSRAFTWDTWLSSCSR